MKPFREYFQNHSMHSAACFTHELCRHRHKQSTGQYVDDSAITAKVKAAIFDEDSLKSRQINVETFKGVVQLSGFVDSSKNSRKAEQLAEDVDGVKSVINNIVVK
jgi:osmotically-inducible protein OsmY